MKRILALTLITFLMLCCLSTFAADKPPYLLHWGSHCQPDYIAKNINTIEQRPFDGLIIQQNSLAIPIMLKPMTYDEMVKCLEPLKKDTFKKFKHNFIQTYWGGFTKEERVPDLFDDWTLIINNFGTLAKVCRDFGYEGVFIDNEEYTYSYWNYPQNVKYKDKTLAQYHLQAHLRGRQIMQAMCKVYPKVAAISLHGPYISCAESASRMKGFMGDGDAFIMGAFVAGIIDGSGSKSIAADGGELYDLNTKDQFDQSYKWRKYGIAAPETKCLFMDDNLKKVWPKKCSISYGVFDKELNEKKDGWVTIKDPQLLKDRIRLALFSCDKYVWFYTESTDWLVTPQDCQTGSGRPVIPSDDWVKAVREGKEEAQKAK